jgi:hypothetical protein
MGSAESPPRRRTGPWPFLFALLALVAMLSGSLLYVFHTIARAPGAAIEQGREALRSLERVAAAFRTGTVTTRFARYATEIEGVSRLQIATLRQDELFERTDESTVFWGTVELPALVVSARAPVEYTYYLDLDSEWQFREEGSHVRVVAPSIRFNQPAVDVSAIRYEVVRGSLLRDQQAALERLQRGLTLLSVQRARDNLPLVRETGRRQTARFVETWLARQFSDGGSYTVDVLFRDEIERLDNGRLEAPGPG